MEKIQGNVIFEGVVIAKPYIKKKKTLIIEEKKINEESIKSEIAKVEEAIKETRFEIKHLIESLKDRVNKDELKILNVQLLMLEDPVFVSGIYKKIERDMVNAEFAVDYILKKFVNQFKALNDPVYKERAIDVQELGDKIIQNLLFEKPQSEDVDNKILITKELQPFELLKFYNEGVNIKGIITELGGETSHAAILSKALGIPTLMGVDNIVFTEFDEDEEIILDSRDGSACVVLKPNRVTLAYYQNEVQVFDNETREIEALRGKEVITKDGQIIYLKANLGGEIEIKQLNNYLPDGVGLLRTEFIYMDNDDFPSEDEQVKIYENVYNELGDNKPLTIRTLDIGGDKQLSYFKLPEEANPFLGLRAIRLCLKHKNIFKTQLRAILRAAYDKNIKIMYPMVSKLEELWEANKLLEEAKAELLKEGIPFAKSIEVGIMVEVPSTAIMADIFVEEVDFFSVGTNDLTQYVMAADRLSKEVSEVYDKYDPSVIRMIANTADVAIKNNKDISICGEMAGDTLGILIFLTLGVRELSMLPAFLPKAKRIIRDLSMEELHCKKDKLLKCKSSKEVKELFKEYY